jgi:hypothetical protein
LRKGVSTQRITDPLNPKYQFPGATEGDLPYGPDGSSMESKYVQI